ncbi:adenylate/guanylate cyclase domain-containing protein [Actinoplanes sp. NPDC023714]|uniref:ATP-binding protein n=1 Tax=Actinoplanes sp. NPDC023714 TaxID=3154322 RepID=UPI0033ED3DFA
MSARVQPAATESRKVVTVLFSDVAGSTAIGEKLDPESLRRLMTHYFEEMSAVVERHGGITEKFIGDALMAVFGVPKLHEDDALRAVRAAVEMRDALDQLNHEFQRLWGVQIAARTGVNTGEVVAGDASLREAFVAGDAVNVAARLEQAAAAGQILIGESTYRLVRDAVTVTAVPDVVAKGKTAPLRALSLTAIIPDVPGWRRRLDTPLVGREQELAALEEAGRWTVRHRGCKLVTVLGAAGVGKSRLAGEFLSRFAGEARVVTGHCLSYGEGITFWPVAEVVRNATGISGTASPDQIRPKIAELLGGSEHRQLICERMAALLGMPGTTPGIQETFWAVRRFLEALAAERPLVVVFDDIQWGEPTFLDLLEYLVDWIHGVPVLLLCLARGDLLDTRGAWMAGKPDASMIMLHPLTTPQIEGLVGNLLDGTWPPDATSARLVETAEGNPLFAEEMLRMLVDEGRLRRVNDHWSTAGHDSAMAVPPTIHALLTARLDRLDPRERAVVDRASVVGLRFSWRAVAELSPVDQRAGVGGCLQSLTRKELIHPDLAAHSDDDCFRFAHILIRDAAYRQIPKAVRTDLHERLAGWMAERFGERSGEYEEIVGYHFEQAYRGLADLGPAGERATALGRRAAGPLASAGRRAFARGDMPAASNLLFRVAGLLPMKHPQRLRLLPMLGKALRETGRLGWADDVLTEGIELGGAAGDRRVESLARIERASLRDYTNPSGEPDELRRVAEHSIGVFAELDDHAGLAQAGSLLAEAHWTHGEFAAMEEVLERALRHAQLANDVRGRSFLLTSLARAALLGPAPVEAALRRCEEIMTEAGDDRVLIAAVLPPAAGLHALRGDFDRARSMHRRARADFTEFGMTSALAALPLYSGPIELLAGDAPAAERELRRGYELLTGMGDRSRYSTVAAFLAQALYAQDRFGEANEQALSAAATATADDFYTQTVWRGTRALILAHAGDAEQALALARHAVALTQNTDSLNLAGDALLVLAEVLVAAGHRDDAAVYAREALRRYRDKGNAVSSRRAEDIASLDRNRPPA